MYCRDSVVTRRDRSARPDLLAGEQLPLRPPAPPRPTTPYPVHPLVVFRIRDAKFRAMAPKHYATMIDSTAVAPWWHCPAPPVRGGTEPSSAAGGGAMLAPPRGRGGAGRRHERAACGLPRPSRPAASAPHPVGAVGEPSANRRPRIECRPMMSRATGHSPWYGCGHPESRSERKIAKRPQKNMKARCCW